MKRVAARMMTLAGVLGGLATGLVGAAPTAGAVSGVEVGYWHQRPGPAQVPPGGYEVASDPSGTQAVAAIRFTLGDGESQPILHLKVAQVLPDSSQLAVIVCQVAAKSAAWKPTPDAAGAWADAPAADCSGGSATGKLSADGTSMTVDLSTMSFADSTVDVVLSPDVVASPVPGGVVDGVGGQGPATFDAAFQPVTPADVELSSSGASGGSGAVPSGSSGTSSGSAGAGGSAGGNTTGGSSPSGAALAAALPAGAGLSAPAVAAPPVAPVVAQPQTVAGQQQVAATGPLLAHRSRNLRLLMAVAMLSADVLFGLLWLQRKYDDAPGTRPLLSIYDPPPAA